MEIKREKEQDCLLTDSRSRGFVESRSRFVLDVEVDRWSDRSAISGAEMARWLVEIEKRPVPISRRAGIGSVGMGVDQRFDVGERLHRCAALRCPGRRRDDATTVRKRVGPLEPN